ncbi:hypothetical protein V2K69_04030, partial [Pseudomonas alliivorans]|nr:hypothetical protein [Pseudomonas alliivorans]MEE4720206.1 hypothetical protein [Pseudomonas alliivorans]MEE4756132.1 hypothetical protein [Pseudomonas alliivorans]MEE4761933.1 hypothetical protein [Pseudomonas alliivorans]MEE4772104.1 hypothetical protein [Pseudomonas alliivorans]
MFQNDDLALGIQAAAQGLGALEHGVPDPDVPGDDFRIGVVGQGVDAVEGEAFLQGAAVFQGIGRVVDVGASGEVQRGFLPERRFDLQQRLLAQYQPGSLSAAHRRQGVVAVVGTQHWRGFAMSGHGRGHGAAGQLTHEAFGV